LHSKKLTKNSNSFLNIYYQNVRSLNNKLTLLKSLSPLSLYNILIFTETWLNDNIHSSELGLYDYIIYRYDRNEKTSSLSRDGGVLIAIHKSLPSKPLIVENNNLEILFVLIKLHNQSVIISSVYIPNRSNQNIFDTYFSLVESLYHKNPNATFILVGDYNLPSAKLNNSE